MLVILLDDLLTSGESEAAANWQHSLKMMLKKEHFI